MIRTIQNSFFHHMSYASNAHILIIVSWLLLGFLFANVSILTYVHISLFHLPIFQHSFAVCLYLLCYDCNYLLCVSSFCIVFVFYVIYKP